MNKSTDTIQLSTSTWVKIVGFLAAHSLTVFIAAHQYSAAMDTRVTRLETTVETQEKTVELLTEIVRQQGRNLAEIHGNRYTIADAKRDAESLNDKLDEIKKLIREKH